MSYNFSQMIAVIEDYIYQKKGVKVKINYNIFESHLIIQAYTYIMNLYNQQEKDEQNI